MQPAKDVILAVLNAIFNFYRGPPLPPLPRGVPGEGPGGRARLVTGVLWKA